MFNEEEKMYGREYESVLKKGIKDMNSFIRIFSKKSVRDVYEDMNDNIYRIKREMHEKGLNTRILNQESLLDLEVKKLRTIVSHCI